MFGISAFSQSPFASLLQRNVYVSATISVSATVSCDASISASATAAGTGLTFNNGEYSLDAQAVMDVLKTVDSDNSGLNADTLDGQEGTYYRINVYDAAGTLLN